MSRLASIPAHAALLLKACEGGWLGGDYSIITIVYSVTYIQLVHDMLSVSVGSIEFTRHHLYMCYNYIDQ